MVHVLQIIVYMYSSGKMNRMDNDACIVYVRVREGALILHFQLNDMYIMFQANMKSTNDADSFEAFHQSHDAHTANFCLYMWQWQYCCIHQFNNHTMRPELLLVFCCFMSILVLFSQRFFLLKKIYCYNNLLTFVLLRQIDIMQGHRLPLRQPRQLPW